MAHACPTILQIIPELDAGGAERTTIEVARAIVSAGGRAIILSEGGRLEHDARNAGAEVVHFPAATKNPLRIVSNAAAIARLAVKEGVDLIHARSRAPAWSAYLAARRTKRPFVTTYHGIYGEKGRAKRLYNSVMARGDLIIANSEYTAAIVRERYAVDPARIVVVNRGVDIEHFDRRSIAPERIAAIRTSWGAASGQRIVLHPARLTRWKGQEVVIAAAAHLASDARLAEVLFILAGDAQGRDDYRNKLQAQIARNGLGERVRIVGHVADMPTAIAASDVVIVASIEPEAFGRTAVEAQAIGVPVIATNIGAPAYTVLAPPAYPVHAATGRLVPPADAAALATALAGLLSVSPAERASLAERARAHVATRYTTTALQQATLRVYDSLLNTALEHNFTSPGAS